MKPLRHLIRHAAAIAHTATPLAAALAIAAAAIALPYHANAADHRNFGRLNDDGSVSYAPFSFVVNGRVVSEFSLSDSDYLKRGYARIVDARPKPSAKDRIVVATGWVRKDGTIYRVYEEMAVGAITEEADPLFAAYTNSANIALGAKAIGNGHQATALGTNSKVSGYYAVAAGASSIASNFRSSAFGSSASAIGRQASAIGTFAYAGIADSLAFPTDAEHTYFNSVMSNKGATAVSLQSYLDDKADATNVYSKSEIDAKISSAAPAESDPIFAAWTNGTSVVLGNKATKGQTNGTSIGLQATVGTVNSTAVGAFSKAGFCSSAFGYGATASGGYSLALGYDSYAPNDSSMGLPFTPSSIYLGAKKSDTAGRTLQSYLDERAPRYAFGRVRISAASITAVDGKIYMYTADTNGISVTLPVAASYVQDFVIRLEPADTNGTRIAAISPASADKTAWKYDYPCGTNAVWGVITEATYFTFTQVSETRWSIGCFPATKQEK